MTAETEKGRPGQAFDDFLKEQGTYEETTEQAVKRVLAFQLAEAMKSQGITKVEMAICPADVRNGNHATPNDPEARFSRRIDPSMNALAM